MSLRHFAAFAPAVLFAGLLLASPLAGARERGFAAPGASASGGLASCAAPDAPPLGVPQDCDWRAPVVRAALPAGLEPVAVRASAHAPAIDLHAARAPARLARWGLAHSTSTSFS